MFEILKKLNLIIFFLLFVFAYPVSAATLSFEPSVGSLGPGNVFALDVVLDVETCVNTIEADIGFPKEYIQLKDFIVGESILPIWLERPDEQDIALANSVGIINFSGGIPGGYCGQIPGDPGKSNIVARLIFAVNDQIEKKPEDLKLSILFLPNTKVLLNDGLGTFDVLTKKIASFNYVNEKVDINDDWLKEIEADIIPPEPFVVELRQNKKMFDNQYYIIFSTTDKQSGLDHFEVLEIRYDQELGIVRDLSFLDKILGKKPFVPHWNRANIPYLLHDQKLLSIIRVKAIDKAGNERFVEYIPPDAGAVRVVNDSRSGKFLILGLIILGALIFLSVLIVTIRKIILNKKNRRE